MKQTFRISQWQRKRIRQALYIAIERNETLIEAYRIKPRRIKGSYEFFIPAEYAKDVAKWRREIAAWKRFIAELEE